MYQHRSPIFGPQSPFGQQMSSPFMQIRPPMQIPSQPRGVGGLLSRIFGKTAGPTNGFQGMQGMGFPPFAGNGMFGPTMQSGIGHTFGNLGQSGLSNTFGGITGMLNNVQRAIGLAQQFGPMIQQYGPFVKNLPAMLKIMKELNDSESEENSNSESSENEVNLNEIEIPNLSEGTSPTSPTNAGLSKPKLYI